MKTKENNMQIGFPGLLTLIFITLKLTGHIDWSWVWVLSPTWITLLIAFIVIGIGVMMGAKPKIK
ncbi:MAG: hypothetical protein EBU90_26755 [Proteobacteria bacterium]|nr:hypothetical protein [Pseudomonadota bacterium]